MISSMNQAATQTEGVQMYTVSEKYVTLASAIIKETEKAETLYYSKKGISN